MAKCCAAGVCWWYRPQALFANYHLHEISVSAIALPDLMYVNEGFIGNSKTGFNRILSFRLYVVPRFWILLLGHWLLKRRCASAGSFVNSRLFRHQLTLSAERLWTTLYQLFICRSSSLPGFC